MHLLYLEKIYSSKSRSLLYQKYDYLVIESTGISEPLPVATTFDYRDDEGKSLSDVATLDTMVTVVDGANLVQNYTSVDFIKDRGESLGDDDERTLVDLLVEQIEFANVIVINKIDLINTKQLAFVKSIIKSLNIKAKIIETTNSKVDTHLIINTGLFDFEEAENHPLWAQELHNFQDHLPETEEYGINSFVFRAREPFDPVKLNAFMQQDWQGVIRSKGFFWLASRPDFVGELAQAGAFVSHQGAGRWWISTPKTEWPDDKALIQDILSDWHDFYGDRKQEIVFIGLDSDMDETKIRKSLEDCLIKDYEANPQSYQNIDDPMPQWFEDTIEA